MNGWVDIETIYMIRDVLNYSTLASILLLSISYIKNNKILMRLMHIEMALVVLVWIYAYRINLI